VCFASSAAYSSHRALLRFRGESCGIGQSSNCQGVAAYSNVMPSSLLHACLLLMPICTGPLILGGVVIDKQQGGGERRAETCRKFASHASRTRDLLIQQVTDVEDLATSVSKVSTLPLRQGVGRNSGERSASRSGPEKRGQREAER